MIGSRIVVADAGPLHYLILIDCAENLRNLFDKILVPKAVRDELCNRGSPQKVKDWILGPKKWIQIEFLSSAVSIHGLHLGESEALQLALQNGSIGVLMDDLDGRNAARRLGLPAVGTVGLLERLAEKNLILLSDAIARLQQTNFFISPGILSAALKRDRLRRG